jgi:hypothetical protein
MELPLHATAIEKRAAPRHKITLERNILVSAITSSLETEQLYYAFSAYLQDVSLSGLGMTVYAADVEGFGIKEGLKLRLMLPLPAKAIDLEAEIVRFEPIENTIFLLIGARITDMIGSDRIIFMEFIRGFET